MNCGIYLIINKENRKFYIGSSNNFKVRFKTHRNQLNANRHHSKHLQAAWNLYGENKFEFKGIIELPDDKNILHKIEQSLLSQYYGKQYCYNGHPIARGGALSGEKNHMYGKTHSKEVKKFLSEINTGPNNYWYDKPQHMENMRSKITKRFHGRKHTDETKEKMSRSRKGKKHTKETCMKISKAQKNQYNSGREKQKKPIVINDIYYESLAEAGRAFNVPANTIKYRVLSNNFPNYQYFQEGVETIERTSLDES
ncbi:GIY-YIG nuclease [Bacillus wiedmannii]|nr:MULTISPECIES: group I intron GIY-YIG endonuclease [Bacillus]EOP08030.1 group I intron endonuclease [Bacillus cereus BAG2O-3]EOQ13270.1 group I intron endonuclease [Bacillus cereus B5-2]PEW47738.1 GIY-YIG nuclease [Bacillus cereus]PFW82901.1 GIY-YIG nuclease [Bacillus sp. AFS075960]RFB48709.1 GIY-YIG nuclease [Bacillus sp. dmp10]HDR8170917.1 group I intron GIY-YIG endonuclease [Bacillus thuringiensis]